MNEMNSIRYWLASCCLLAGDVHIQHESVDLGRNNGKSEDCDTAQYCTVPYLSNTISLVPTVASISRNLALFDS